MVKGEETEWKRVNKELVPETHHVVTGLQTGAEYKFRVAAVNHVGRGEDKEIPEPAQADLLEGVPYFFRVSAENQHGIGEAFELTEPVIATAEPSAPKRMDILDTTDSSVSLGWLKPEHDGGSRIQQYVIEAKAKGTDKWMVVGNTKNLTYVVEKLNKGDEYDFRVKAKNESGYSIPKETLAPVLVKEPHIEPAADLSEIANQLITCRSGNTFTIDVPIIGRPAPKVTWKLEEMRLKSSDRVSIKVTKDRTSISVKESMRGDGGKYYLTLENVAGTRTFTIEVNVTARPSPPTGPIEISSITSESCVINWQPPEDDGGTDITNYIVEKRESGSTAWQLINSSVKRTSLHVSHLTKYMQYTFRVSAENRFGVSNEPCAETEPVERIGKQTPETAFRQDNSLMISRQRSKTICLRAGGSLRLFVNVTGRPAPAITWSKPGVVLQNRGFVEVTNTSTTLIIDKVHRYDAGKYTLMAENSAGKQEVNILVKVYGKFMILSETKGDFQKLISLSH
uniref:Titin n=1 Tax=Amphiprion percula TaxID=161767 RepID=A0A3P8T1H8_AMPPE